MKNLKRILAAALVLAMALTAAACHPKDEIAVSEYIYEVFKKAGYFDGVTYNKAEDGSQTPVYSKISGYDDLLGRQIIL